ncbi:dipeptidase 1 isoform X2 [Fopius arisanus]|uniref:Dipeptidase n=2 Tax=Fopius arisanus TaxID=64838 RepID=A0A9R1TRX9_9HYME|nr:PREDICTED: dipeptidase 1-like isoform X2 [Fopius arisanus]
MGILGKMVFIGFGALSLALALVIGFSWGLSVQSFQGSDVLKDVPLIDGHNDLAWNLYLRHGNNLSAFHFDQDLRDDPIMGTAVCDACRTDLPRLAKGKIGGQFWSAYVGCDSQYKDAIQLTLRQIDVIKRLINKYPDNLEFVTEAGKIESVWKTGKIASMIGVEGGHLFDSSLGVLRLYYELGVRYITLTHTCNTPWADASTVNEGSVYNLTDFGKTIVHEMNRLGMMIDLSHVSHNVMRDVLVTTKAPVIFSHSSSFSVCDHYRNVPDDVLYMVKENRGIVMVNFYNNFVNCNETREASIEDVVEHINYIKNLIGPDHIGIGGDYDGVNDMPKGLEDVSTYPNLFNRLYNNRENETEWSREDLEKLAGRNLIRVFGAVEEVRDSLSEVPPSDRVISGMELYMAQKKEGLKPGACQTATEVHCLL